MHNIVPIVKLEKDYAYGFGLDSGNESEENQVTLDDDVMGKLEETGDTIIITSRAYHCKNRSKKIFANERVIISNVSDPSNHEVLLEWYKGENTVIRSMRFKEGQKFKSQIDSVYKYQEGIDSIEINSTTTPYYDVVGIELDFIDDNKILLEVYFDHMIPVWKEETKTTEYELFCNSNYTLYAEFLGLGVYAYH